MKTKDIIRRAVLILGMIVLFFIFIDIVMYFVSLIFDNPGNRPMDWWDFNLYMAEAVLLFLGVCTLIIIMSWLGGVLRGLFNHFW